jgi:hypothetical protein
MKRSRRWSIVLVGCLVAMGGMHGVAHGVTVSISAPAEGDHVVFDSAYPGVATVSCTAAATPSNMTSSIWWSAPQRAGSQSFSGTGGSVTLTLTGLPAGNSAFGNFPITAQIGTTCPVASDTHTTKLFFGGNDSDTNHPGQGSPNWYYYWKQTGAVAGSPSYDGGSSLGYTTWSGAAWISYLGIGDNNSYTPAEGDNARTALDGIDHFAWACRHEARHVTTFSAWYPQGVTSSDTDGDGLPDNQEAALGGTQQNPLNGGPFTSGVPDTDGDGRPDAEDYTMNTQTPWTKGSADTVDWASPGHQS